ncbi:MAG: hypothetical protein AB7F59_08315 [Bdellovibrionales bacterium]
MKYKNGFLLFSTFLFTACLQVGPTTQSGKDPTAQMANTASGRILASLCSRLNSCNITTDTRTCLERALELRNIDNELGVPQGKYANYQALVDAELAKKMSVNFEAADVCMNSIDQLDCNDQSVKRAYDTTLSNPFARMADMIPKDSEGCQAVFK